MKKNHILLVDDDITIVNLLTDILTDAGFFIVPAYNGMQAISIAEVEDIDLIILDWNMPELNGIDALRILVKNESTCDIPVIMLTGVMTDSDNLKMALDAGAFDFIRKNFDKIELLSRINAALKFSKVHKEALQLKQNEVFSANIEITRKDNFLDSQIQSVREIISDYKMGINIDEKLDSLFNTLQSFQRIKGWDNFNVHFNKTNPEFFRNLAQKHNDLSPSEMKLCALLKLNLNTKEIADITQQSSDSIKTSRVRLRRKLNINSEVNLTNYLMQF